MDTFVPPDARQVDWMFNHNADQSYLEFVTHVQQLLCLYAPSHGFPHAWHEGEDQGQYEDRMRRLVENFELEASSHSGEYQSILDDLAVNRRAVLRLHQRLVNVGVLDSDADNFLGTLMDAYTFVTMAAKHRSRP